VVEAPSLPVITPENYNINLFQLLAHPDECPSKVTLTVRTPRLKCIRKVLDS